MLLKIIANLLHYTIIEALRLKYCSPVAPIEIAEFTFIWL